MQRNDEVLDLGSATVETRGPIGDGADDVLQRKAAGLSDD
ncbi:MAG: benenodin family lasso peptide [Sphingomonadaceae bacterium]|nr:benenodin family lasso peptide [Sphingomonadaceae bacterium]